MNALFARLLSSRMSQPVQRLRDHLKTPLFMNAYLLIINQGLSAALGIVYWMAAARFYSTDFVGRGSAIISTLGFLEVLAEFSLKSAMQRFIPRAGMKVRRLVLITYGTVLVTGALFTVGFFVLGHVLHFADSLLAGLSTTSLFLLVLANMAYTIFVVQDGVLMGLRQTKWVLIENTLYNVTKMGLLVVGIFGFLGNGIVASWFIPAPLLVLLVNTLIFLRFIPRFNQIPKPSLEPVTSRQIIRMVAGDHLGTVLSETSIRLLPLMVLNLLGTSANAFFYQAWLIGMMLYLLSWNVAASFSVEGSSDPEKLTHYSRQTLRQILFLMIPAALVIFAGAPLILRIFGPAYALNGTTLLRWLALAAVPYGINAWFLSYSRVQMNIRPVILFQGLQCVITLGLSYWGLPRFGLSAIGVAWLIAQTVLMVLALLSTRRILLGTREKRVQPVAERVADQPDADLGSSTSSPARSRRASDWRVR